jgi:hypothetical protein
MELSLSWEANSYLVIQEISTNLLYPKVHYLVHKSPQLGSILSQMNPVHNAILFL